MSVIFIDTTSFDVWNVVAYIIQFCSSIFVGSVWFFLLMRVCGVPHMVYFSLLWHSLFFSALFGLTEQNGAEWNVMEQNGIEISFHCLGMLWSDRIIFSFHCLKNRRNGTNYDIFIPFLPLFKNIIVIWNILLLIFLVKIILLKSSHVLFYNNWELAK